jgi:hypothetical protein
MLTNAEKIAEKIEAIVEEAKQLNVNVYALVQADSQGAVYYHAKDKQALTQLVSTTLEDVKSNDFEQDGVGSVGYGL